MTSRNIYLRSGQLDPLFRIFGWLLILEALLMLLPLGVCLIYGEADWLAFCCSAAATGMTGGALAFRYRNSSSPIFRREGYLLISSVWIFFSIFGMIPFLLCESPLTLTDAFFETMSGFTTTGASVIADVEAQSHGILLWRALTQWLGGLGIVMFLIAIIPSLNDSGGISLFNAEVTGISREKLHPRIRQTVISLWTVYAMLTLLQTAVLLFIGMGVFDSVCQACSTMSTGGFSTRNGGIAAWHSPAVAWAVTFFMFVGGINFISVYNAMRGNARQLFRNNVFRAYLGIVFIAVLAMAGWLHAKGARSVDELLLSPLFMVCSAVTSTGFEYCPRLPFAAWGPLPLIIVIFLMTCGACAGSTTGGIKIDRAVALSKNLRNEIVHTLMPNCVKRVEVGGKEIPQNIMLRIAGFITIYIMTVSVGAMAMTAYGYELTDSFFASTSCMGNAGLGYGATGAGYSALPDALKWLFSFEMLIGRLEIYPVLALCCPPLWRK